MRRSSSHAAASVTVDDFASLAWRTTREAPVIGPPAGSPILADPTFLLPHDTPDGRWHLFAHSIWGLHHFSAIDGIQWSRPRLAVRHAMRAFLHREGAIYHLFYERYPPSVFRSAPFPASDGARGSSRRWSSDLVRWSAPAIVLRPSLDWHRTSILGEAIGNPCLVRTAEGYALYYSAGLVHVPDCGFNEPLHVGVAWSATLDGPWRRVPTRPLPACRRPTLQSGGASTIKVLRLDDGFVGLQNGIALDPGTRQSHSAISVLRSLDGLDWRYAHAEPIVGPTAGWRARFVYACDVRREPTGRWYLYFNARDRAPMLSGREAIGFVVAESGCKAS